MKQERKKCHDSSGVKINNNKQEGRGESQKNRTEKRKYVIRSGAGFGFGWTTRWLETVSRERERESGEHFLQAVPALD